MKSLEKLKKIIPPPLYFKKVDPMIKRIISIKKVKTIPIIITLKRPLESHTESLLKQKGFRIKHHLPFINTITGKINTRSFDSISSIVEISKIYFDGTASLMGRVEGKDIKTESTKATPSYLGGKGITAAFIDSGVYPHPDLTRPQNRIVGFKDFLNGIDKPYDDNGHGTACIGAAFGASDNGKFKTPAYDCNIVCAKAFNALGYGSFSDILAAMQWISDLKEKYNIKVLVLPFGSCCTAKHFDILSQASEVLWANGFFVCTCSGNLGPYEASITSPGVCGVAFTTGACNASGSSSKVTRFSGRGPAECNLEKPDAVMPGYKVTTLKADTDYIPANSSLNKANTLRQYYTNISGTSVSASLAASAAVLLCRKKPDLQPKDIKSVLRSFCASINELKNAQGEGIIEIKRIEEYE